MLFNLEIVDLPRNFARASVGANNRH